MLQSRIFAACTLRLDMQNPGKIFPATCRMWLIRLAALNWINRPDLAFALLSSGSFAPSIQEIAANCEKYIRAKDTQVSLI